MFWPKVDKLSLRDRATPQVSIPVLCQSGFVLAKS